jgi:pimeloyl-ACP methyl ester carboxylesterase
MMEMRIMRPAVVAAAIILAAGTAGAQAGAPASAAAESEIRVETPTGALAGSLLLPSGPGPHPVALVIAGSGPTDRNGNSALGARNESLRMLAEGLAARGVATARYDKRGLGGSVAAGRPERELRLDTFADDAAAWLRMLRADARFSTVSVVGHSEGALLGARAAASAGADAFVSIAGPGNPLGATLRTQLRAVFPPALLSTADSILTDLEAGRTRDTVPSALFALFRPSVQPYLISLLRTTPAAEVAQLTVPVLVVQGTTDIQVAVTDAEALHHAQPTSRLLVIEGMNHVLKAVPADRARQAASYSDPTLPVVPQLIEEVAAFIRAAPRR